MRRYLRRVIIPCAEFKNFIINGFGEEPIFKWLGPFKSHHPVTWIIDRVRTVNDDRLSILGDLLRAQALLWLRFCRRVDLASARRTLDGVTLSDHYLEWPWYRACRTFNSLIGLPYRWAIVARSNYIDEVCLALKLGSSAGSRGRQLSVPPPSQRLEDSFVDIERGREEDRATEELYRALRLRADSVPCGNPFSYLLFSLWFERCRRSRKMVAPCKMTPELGLLFDVFAKLVSRCVLNCVISLPIVSKSVVEAVYKKRGAPVVLTCRDCGHPLNFGRGKFKKIHFKPSHVFYCRDQKEKQFTICSSSGRVYCNFCGSPHIRKVSLCGVRTTSGPFLRAVLANNAASTLREQPPDAQFHVAVPCLGSHCSAVILKAVTRKSLLYLTQHPGNLFCGGCGGCHHGGSAPPKPDRPGEAR